MGTGLWTAPGKRRSLGTPTIGVIMTKKVSILGRIREYFLGTPSHEASEDARRSMNHRSETAYYAGEAVKNWTGTSGGAQFKP